MDFTKMDLRFRSVAYPQTCFFRRFPKNAKNGLGMLSQKIGRFSKCVRRYEHLDHLLEQNDQRVVVFH